MECVTAGLKWLGKAKKVVVDNELFRIGQEQEEFPRLNWNNLYKYLGIEVSLKGTTRWVGGRLRDSVS